MTPTQSCSGTGAEALRAGPIPGGRVVIGAAAKNRIKNRNGGSAFDNSGVVGLQPGVRECGCGGAAMSARSVLAPHRRYNVWLTASPNRERLRRLWAAGLPLEAGADTPVQKRAARDGGRFARGARLTRVCQRTRQGSRKGSFETAQPRDQVGAQCRAEPQNVLMMYQK